MSTVYDADPPGFTGVHYGRDGLGLMGYLIPTDGIAAGAVTIDPAKEYRVFFSSLPAGFIEHEHGAGIYTGPLNPMIATAKVYEDGVEK